MNSLNILSGIGSTPASPVKTRSHSHPNVSTSNIQSTSENEDLPIIKTEDDNEDLLDIDRPIAGSAPEPEDREEVDEKSPLLGERKVEGFEVTKPSSRWTAIPKRIASGIIGGVRVVLSAITAPGYYVIACFYDEDGHFSAIMPVLRITRKLPRKKRKNAPQALGSSNEKSSNTRRQKASGDGKSRGKRSKRGPADAASSDSDTSSGKSRSFDGNRDSPARNTRSKSLPTGDEIAPAKRSIRIKLYNEDALKQRRQRKEEASKASEQSSTKETSPTEQAAAYLKSPTSPANKLKYPRAPVPPRPLVPRRQPSYSGALNTAPTPPQKTLILDLDETLIHSYAQGGKYATGHMVEVRMDKTIGVGGVQLGPQVPILYYVHKRPHCDEFLRKVSKWYNLIIFTASVQEYADPVIDWLELERKYFSARYYRQHCTQRNGAYIKDLSHVEPDLSKVMIIDNSPLSYIFHEDNAIPIEGWISDPTDNDLLHLVPLLEGLQYATDVRAVLALRLGQPQTA